MTASITQRFARVTQVSENRDILAKPDPKKLACSKRINQTMGTTCFDLPALDGQTNQWPVRSPTL
jgi:hypothetical protein